MSATTTRPGALSVLLNSFWGYLALRQERHTLHLVDSIAELNRLFDATDYTVNAIEPLTSDMVSVNVKEAGRKYEPRQGTSVCAAALVTAYGRLLLTKAINALAPVATVAYADTVPLSLSLSLSLWPTMSIIIIIIRTPSSSAPTRTATGKRDCGRQVCPCATAFSAVSATSNPTARESSLWHARA